MMSEDYMIDISVQQGLSPGSLYALSISRASVEMSSFDFIDRCLSYLKDQGNQSFGTVIIMIDGYENESDEVYEIPEVRKWMASLFERYPYFLYFINWSLDSHITLLACIGDIVVMTEGEKTRSPMEYLRLGIDPFSDIEQKKWKINLSDDLFSHLTESLIEYGLQCNDSEGATQTIKMIRAITGKTNRF